MDRFKKNFGGNRGGGFNRGGRSDFRNGGRGGDRKEMFDAVCAQCHKSCKIPFRPMTDKPVYCSDCFGSKQGESSRGNFDRRNDRNSRPSFEKRDFTSSVQAQPQVNDKKIEDIKKELESLNFKIDKIMQILNDSKSIKTTGDKQIEKKPIENITKTVIKKSVSSDKKTTKKVVAKKKPASKKK
jgi:CxxC-x17-CxxC domain-containing protein